MEDYHEYIKELRSINIDGDIDHKGQHLQLTVKASIFSISSLLYLLLSSIFSKAVSKRMSIAQNDKQV